MLCVLYHATSLLSCEKPFNISVKRSTIRSRARPPPPRPDAESSELPKCRPARAAHMVFCACYGAHTIQIKLCHGQHARWRACMLTKPTGVTSASHMSRCAVRQLVTLGAPCIWDNSRHSRSLLRLLRDTHDPHQPHASPTRKTAQLCAWKFHQRTVAAKGQAGRGAVVGECCGNW